MSVGEQLFVRGMKTCENGDIWDDTQLVKAYDKAMKCYKPVEMAQRIAMATNAKAGGKGKTRWCLGSACRALYEDDGQDYEAYIVEMCDDDTCVVRFVGYGDDATVKLSDLKPSHGAAARSEQVYNITTEPSWKEIMKTEFDGVLDSASEADTMREAKRVEKDMSHDSRHSDDARSKRTKKNKKHKRKQSSAAHDQPHDPRAFGLINACVPDFSMLSGLPSMPPLPPLLPPAESDDEHEILNNLLTAWYMSGYYAGVYQSCMKKKSKKSS